MTSQTTKRRVLSVFSLVMINIIAIDSLRNLPINAEYSLGIIIFYLIATCGFFIPCALISAELATQWPKTGGAYVWVREAFGPKWGFVNVWLQWVYNIVWYPAILTFISTSIAFLFFPHLLSNKYFIASCVLLTFSAATILNWFGMRLSSLISTIGAIFGTLVPFAIIITLGIIWLSTGHTSQIVFSFNKLIPDDASFHNIAFFSAVLYSLAGIEMSAVHAEEVKNPRKNYPRALLISALIIVFSMILSSLAVGVVAPHNELNIVNGLNIAFGKFYAAFHIKWMLPITELMIIIGGFAGVATWIIGPTKGLLASAKDKSIPEVFARTNKYHSPTNILILQFIIVLILSSCFIFMPTVSAAYWLLTDLTAILALSYYLLLFMAGIYLRYKHPVRHKDVFMIPGGNVGMWIAGSLGVITCILAIIIGFFPPADVKVGSTLHYDLMLGGGWLAFVLVPIGIIGLYNKIKR